MQTDIHHPTDNTLLWDVVRVVTRLVGRLKKAIQSVFGGSTIASGWHDVACKKSSE